MSPSGVSMPCPAAPKSTKELLQIFDKNVKAGRACQWQRLSVEQAVVTARQGEGVVHHAARRMPAQVGAQPHRSPGTARGLSAPE
jgi:hypothetical protein